MLFFLFGEFGFEQRQLSIYPLPPHASIPYGFCLYVVIRIIFSAIQRSSTLPVTGFSYPAASTLPVTGLQI
jgi:hypothetical protein